MFGLSPDCEISWAGILSLKLKSETRIHLHSRLTELSNNDTSCESIFGFFGDYWSIKIWRLVNNFCSHNKVDCSEIPIVLSNLLYHYFFIELWHILNLWLAKMSRPNLRIVSKLTTDVVTYRYCTEASNQKSKYAYRKIFLYKKSTVITYLHIATSA